jgi:hypothetical protein
MSAPQSSTAKKIQTYLNSLSTEKHMDMSRLHDLILALMPDCDLWFLDGKDATGKTVSNPNIGYGHHDISYANGSVRDFYRIGLSANTGGISVYIFGIKNKTFLSQKFSAYIGKATVSGYCIKFKKLADIDLGTLTKAIETGIAGKE